MYIIIAEQNLDALVFWVEIVLTILNYNIGLQILLCCKETA